MERLDCARLRRLLDAAHDGELDLLAQVAVEDHLSACAECRAALAARRALSAHLRQATRHAAPESLRRRLSGQPQPRRWWGAGAGVVAAAASVALYLATPDQSLERDMLAAHVHAVAAEHLTDVTSTDRHTVKPWFAGRIALSPPVPDLADAGFPLAGGRLDHLDGRPAAALVYWRHRHVITLFAWAAAGSRPARTRQLDGYQMVEWAAGDLSYAAVSDLNPAELQQFQRLWAERAQ